MNKPLFFLVIVSVALLCSAVFVASQDRTSRSFSDLGSNLEKGADTGANLATRAGTCKDSLEGTVDGCDNRCLRIGYLREIDPQAMVGTGATYLSEATQSQAFLW